MQQGSYLIGAVRAKLGCTDPAQFAKLAELWQTLFQMQADVDDVQCPTLTFHFTEPLDSPFPETAATPLWQYGRLHVWQTTTGFYLTCGDSALTIDSAQANAKGSLAVSFWTYRLVEQREFFQLALFLLLRRQGIYLLHTNGVVPPQPTANAGFLLIGDCGAGKTTLTLSLLTAGWFCVGDDQLMLQSEARQPVTAYALRRGFSCTVQTANAFPALAAAQPGPALNREKTLLHLDKLYPERFVRSCTPRILLFPQIAHTAVSRLVLLNQTQTMLALLGQPRTGVLADPPTVPGYLDLLKVLVQQARGYQIYLGRDVLEWPNQFSEMLLTTILCS